MIVKLRALKNQVLSRPYAVNALWLFGEKILRMCTSLFIGIWVARYLGANRFGMFSYAQSFVGLFTIFANLGLDGIVVRELVRDESRSNDIIGTAFWLKVLGAFVVLILLLVAVNVTSTSLQTKILVLIIASATIFQSFNVIDFYFQSKVLGKYIVYANTISNLISSILKIVLILIDAPLVAFAWTVVFDSVVLAFGSLYFYLRHNKNFKVKHLNFNRITAVELLRNSWPLILVGMASMINMRVDQVMLGNMLSYDVVGNYAAAVRIAELWLVLPVVIGQSVFPSIISAHKLSAEAYRKKIFETVKYMSFFAVPFAVAVSFFSNEIVLILYGAKFQQAGVYLSLYIWTGLPYVVLFVFGQVFLIENLTKWNLFITIVAVVANLSLNYFIIPKYGALGALFVTLFVAYLSQLIVFGILYNRTKVFN
jgi:O-antigen/teichoic acid export membrane protein